MIKNIVLDFVRISQIEKKKFLTEHLYSYNQNHVMAPIGTKKWYVKMGRDGAY